MPPRLLVLALLAAVLAGCGEPASSGGVARRVEAVLDFPTLKTSQYDPATGEISFPEPLASLDGKEVAIAGFMAPYDLLDDMTRFMLMPSYVGCYFCKPPALNQVLYIEQDRETAGSAPQFIEEPIMVSGVLRLFRQDSEHPGHLAEFVYALDDASIEVLDGPEALERARAVHTEAGQQNPAHDALGSGKTVD